jgi:hypothetical protein
VTIAGIIQRGKGRAGAWRVERDESDPFVGQEYSLWHYSTCMLRWRESRRNGVELLDWDIGWGSVSDQNGMNTAFRVLELPYRFDRDSRGGGPRITQLASSNGSSPYRLPANAQRVVLPHSEVCMHMRVAGEAMWVAPVGAYMAQLYDDGGRKFSIPITRGEAGLSS